MRSVGQLVLNGRAAAASAADAAAKAAADPTTTGHPAALARPAAASFCFHRPPYNSIDHLHLHCIGLSPLRRPMGYLKVRGTPRILLSLGLSCSEFEWVRILAPSKNGACFWNGAAITQCRANPNPALYSRVLLLCLVCLGVALSTRPVWTCRGASRSTPSSRSGSKAENIPRAGGSSTVLEGAD
jgi:hypothetical protein